MTIVRAGYSYRPSKTVNRHFHYIILSLVLTSSQVLTERKSFETVVRSSLPAMVEPRVVSVVLELSLLPLVALGLSLLSSVV